MQDFNPIKLVCLLLFCGLIAHTGISQVEAVVKGKVTDENGTPIKNASVKLGNSGSRTNSSGVFVAKTTEFPAKLTITHQLYAEHLEMITLPEKWRDTIRVFVVLTGKEKQLEEVTVSAQKIFWVYPRKQTNVLDFILQPDNGIILCCSDKKDYFVRSLDPQGEKINEIRIRKNPRQLYRDCMQSIHLVYSDSIYETATINNSIGFFPAQASKALFDLLKSCVYMDSKTLIKSNYSKKDQCIEYVAIDIQTKEARTLYIGEDWNYIKGIEEFSRDNAMSDEALFHTLDKDALRIARGKWDKQKLYELVLTMPVYVPLVEVNDSLIIFDHLNDLAVVFTKEGVRVRSYPILYQYLNGWSNELITNLEKTKIYARYETEGITTLREINPQNGKTERLFTLEKHTFPEHLQINGDFVYYLYKDYLDSSIHHLYKQSLK